ncbi:hypothetical protein B0H17DRAFT_648343 [Mycena rosella]|uniref:Ubiquinol-cytochrome C reductase hinge domain-containing protein n=1 Tax=Mycena rosella TaxID=1033263 RepID=A0AAD7GH70_MYCRO|nr:hypothetical protein B0H17DRAFT_648343 [Mycena rosella]
MSGIGSFLSSFLPTIHADSSEESPSPRPKRPRSMPAASAEEPLRSQPHPAIRAACEARVECAPMKHPLRNAREGAAWEGFKGEERVEEMFHMVHCKCAAPQVFSKLR